MKIRIELPWDETAQVAVAARRLDRLDALVDELKQQGAKDVCAVRMDVRDETSIRVGVKKVKRGEFFGHTLPASDSSTNLLRSNSNVNKRHSRASSCDLQVLSLFKIAITVESEGLPQKTNCCIVVARLPKDKAQRWFLLCLCLWVCECWGGWIRLKRL